MISFCIGGTCCFATVQVKQNERMWCENSVVAWCSKCLGGVYCSTAVRLKHPVPSDEPASPQHPVDTSYALVSSCPWLNIIDQVWSLKTSGTIVLKVTSTFERNLKRISRIFAKSLPFHRLSIVEDICFMANIPPLQVPACLLEWFLLVIRVWPRECKPRWIPNGQLLARWYVLVAQLCCK